MTQNKPVLQPAAASDRQRITIDVSPPVMSLLDHYCEVTGQARSAVVNALIVANLATLTDQSQDIKRRSKELLQAKR